MCRAAVIGTLISLPPPACRAAEHSLERSAAAACAVPPFYPLPTVCCCRRFVPRRRLLNCTVCRRRSVPRRRSSSCTVCRRRCAAPPSFIFDSGLPPPLCRAAECYCYRSAAAPVPRCRVLLSSVCSRRCAAPLKYYCKRSAAAVPRRRIIIVNGLPPPSCAAPPYLTLLSVCRRRCAAPPSMIVTGRPLPLCRAAEVLLLTVCRHSVAVVLLYPHAARTVYYFGVAAVAATAWCL